MLTSFNLLRRFFKRPRRGDRGFTLIELLVVSFIMIIITATILFRQQSFNSSTLLRSLAYSIALSMRQAQVYGVSVRESGVGTDIFAAGYGVFFANAGLADANHYLIFSDANGDGQYTAGEELPRFTIGNGKGTDYTLKNFCAHNANTNTDECISGGTIITNLTIYFRRPNPDACFATSNYPAACAPGGSSPYSYAYVQVKAAGGTDVRTVKVSSTGQIAVCVLNVADPSTC